MILSSNVQGRIEYLDRRLERCDLHLANLARIEKRYPWARLAAFIAWFVGTLAGFEVSPGWLGWTALAVFGLIFLVLVGFHRRVLNSLERFWALRQIIAAQAARARLDWEHIPPSPNLRPAANHPFEADLNISG